MRNRWMRDGALLRVTRRKFSFDPQKAPRAVLFIGRDRFPACILLIYTRKEVKKSQRSSRSAGQRRNERLEEREGSNRIIRGQRPGKEGLKCCWISWKLNEPKGTIILPFLSFYLISKLNWWGRGNFLCDRAEASDPALKAKLLRRLKVYRCVLMRGCRVWARDNTAVVLNMLKYIANGLYPTIYCT